MASIIYLPPSHPATVEAAGARATSHRPLAPYVMLALALIGIADAFYVGQATYAGRPLWCPVIDGCNTVANSPYARILGLPLAYFGLVFYLGMFAVAGLLAIRPFARALRLAAVVYAAIGVLSSIYFMYVQLGYIRAVCIYCILSAITTLLLLVAALWHFRATSVDPSRQPTGHTPGSLAPRSP